MNNNEISVPRNEVERLVKLLQYQAHPYPSPHAQYWQSLLDKRADISPEKHTTISARTIEGMVQTSDGQYAVMIDPANGHYGWVFFKHPDGAWVSSRKASKAELLAACHVGGKL